jgi:PhnB protein
MNSGRGPQIPIHDEEGAQRAMPDQFVPDGYHTVIPYLVVPGVAQVLDFMREVFGGQEIERMAQPDGRIMHAEVRIGDSVVMLGEPQEAGKAMPGMLYVYVADTDAAYRRALAAGAVSLQEPADQFYGHRTAGVQDAAGNQWWIATPVENLSTEELERRALSYAHSGASG